MYIDLSLLQLYRRNLLESTILSSETVLEETALVPYSSPDDFETSGLTKLLMTPDMGRGFIMTSEFEYLIDSLVNSQEFVYPNLKKYFEQPLDEIHHQIYVSTGSLLHPVTLYVICRNLELVFICCGECYQLCISRGFPVTVFKKGSFCYYLLIKPGCL